MKLSKTIQKSIYSLPDKLDHTKVVFSELLAIRKKAPLYQDIHWSPNQEQTFNAYWEEHYGYCISSRWHRLYESMNDTFCEAYFPEMLYTSELEPVLNPSTYSKFFNDKSLIELLYAKADGVVFPKTILTCCNGAYRTSDYHLISEAESEDYLADVSKCIIKPTVETGSGHGVYIIDHGRDNPSLSVSDILKRSGKNYIIQELVQNSSELSALYPYSLNTIRLITYLVNDEVHHVSPVLRLGVKGIQVDNIHAGGLCIGVCEDGTLKSTAYQLGYGDKSIKYTEHPDTGIVFSGYYIGDIKQMVAAAENLHQMIPHLGIVSWDLTFNSNHEVVLIEANCKGQSVWFPQIVHGEPIFGSDTPYMLKKIYKKRRI